LDKVTQIGIVRKVNGKLVDVEIARSTSCGEKCSSCRGGCSGTGIIASLENSVGAKVGDVVRIESKSSSIVWSALFVYLLPLVMMVLGMVFGGRIMRNIYPGINSDLSGLVLGFSALVLFYFLLRTVDRWLLFNRKQPIITKIISK